MTGYRKDNCTFPLALALLFMIAAVTQAETFSYVDSWAEQGLTVSREWSGGLELVYSIENWQLEPSLIGGEARQSVLLPGAILPNDAGAPNLPGQGFSIALPNGALAELTVVESRRETVAGIDVAPAFRIPLETEDGPLDHTPNAAIYADDALYPATPIRLGERRRVRGVESMMLGITPFQYNPVQRELTVIRDLRIVITFSGGSGRR